MVVLPEEHRKHNPTLDSLNGPVKCYDKDGTQITMRQWAHLLEDDLEYKIVAQDHPAPNVMVSTVWLGLDHNYSHEGPPIIFETMVFWGNWSGDDDYQQRYSTMEQALEGHAHALEWVRNIVEIRGLPE